MNHLERVVDTVLEQQKLKIAPSTFSSRKGYLLRLVKHASVMGITQPCQELYDSFVTKATTTGLRFQYYHAVRLVDKEAQTKALTPEGVFYNEPEMFSESDAREVVQSIVFPIKDDEFDIGVIIRIAERGIKYLHLSKSSEYQYMQAWRELFVFLYIRNKTLFSRSSCNAFIEETNNMFHEGGLKEWKKKNRCRAVNVLLEIADTGSFTWKLFYTKQPCCPDVTLEALRQDYIYFLRTHNLADKTLGLYDYAFRALIEGLPVSNVSELAHTNRSQIQSLLLFLSKKLSLNSRGTIFPIVRQILSYLFDRGIMKTDYSKMIITPAYQERHLRPYITSSDEEKLIALLQKTSLRNQAMILLAIRLGIRESDICNLRFDQIQWENDQIVLEQEKTGKILYLPLLEDVGNAIMDYILEERPQTDASYPYVFVRMSAPYYKLNTLYHTCSKLFDKADIKTQNRECRGAHVFRHTLVHKLLLQQIPHQVITDVLGHVSKESDKPYISMEEKMLRECPLDLSLMGQKVWEEDECNA